MSEMKLLILTDQEYPSSESFLEGVYSKQFPKHGTKVGFVMSSDRANPSKKSWNGCPVYVLPSSAYRYQKAATDYVSSNYNNLQWVLDDFGNPDILQVRNDLSMGLYAATISDQLGISFFYRISHLKPETLALPNQHNSLKQSIGGKLKCIGGRLVRREIIRNADVILPISDRMSAYLGVESYSVTAPMGVDTSRELSPDVDRFKNQFEIGDGDTILYLGTLSPMRNPTFMVDVLAEILADRQATLLLIGGRNNSWVNEIESYAIKKGIREHITITGWIDDPDVISGGIKTADVAISPLPLNKVYLCSSPTKVLEYLYHGVPVVGSPIPDQKKVIKSSKTGIVSEYNVSSFSSAVIEALSKDYDISIGKSYIEDNRSYDRIFNDIYGVYKNSSNA